MEEYEMGQVECVSCMQEMKCIQNFGQRTLEIDHLGKLDIDGSVKWAVKV
jgi:hypothetical protein